MTEDVGAKTDEAWNEWRIVLQVMSVTAYSTLTILKRLRSCLTLANFGILIALHHHQLFNKEGYYVDDPTFCSFHAWVAVVLFALGIIVPIWFGYLILYKTDSVHRLPHQIWTICLLFCCGPLWNIQYVVRLAQTFPGGQDYCDLDMSIEKSTYHVYGAVYCFGVSFYIFLQASAGVTPLLATERGLTYAATTIDMIKFYVFPLSLALILAFVFLGIAEAGDELLVPVPFTGVGLMLSSYDHSDQWTGIVWRLFAFDCTVVLSWLLLWTYTHLYHGRIDSLFEMREKQARARQSCAIASRHAHNVATKSLMFFRNPYHQNAETEVECAEVNVQSPHDGSPKSHAIGLSETDVSRIDLDTYLMDFRLAQFRYLLFKSFRHTTFWFCLEFQVFSFVFVIYVHQQRRDHGWESFQHEDFNIPSATCLFLNFLALTYAWIQAFMHCPAKHVPCMSAPQRMVVEYEVGEYSGQEELVFDQSTLRLERILFGWNLAELIQWVNDNGDTIQESLQQKTSDLPEDIKLDDRGIGCGVGPLKHCAWKMMVAWYDDQEVWPSLRLPKRLTSQRPSWEKTLAPWAEDGTGRYMMHFTGHLRVKFYRSLIMRV